MTLYLRRVSIRKLQMKLCKVTELTTIYICENFTFAKLPFVVPNSISVGLYQPLSPCGLTHDFIRNKLL